MRRFPLDFIVRPPGFVWACVLVGTTGLAAQDSGPIVIEAEREAEALEASKTGASTVVDLDERRASAESVADVLERETSVRVRRYGGRGYLSTLSIRGSNPNQVNVFIDGIPVSNAVTGEVNLEDYNLDGMSRLEVYRSGDYGGSPIGGSLNLVTRKGGKVKEGVRVKALGGSHRTAGAGGDVFGGDRLRYNVSAKTEVSDQNYTFHNDNGTPILNDQDDFDDRRKNAQYRNYFGTFNLSGHIGNTEIFLLNDGAWRKHGVPGPVPTQTEKTERHVQRNTTGLGTDTKGLYFDWLRLKSRTYYTENRQQFFDPRQEFSFNQPNSRSRLIQKGFHLSPTLYLFDWFQTIRIYAAVDFERYREEDRDRFDDLIERLPPKSREQQTLRMEDEIAFLDERIIFTPSAEYKRYLDWFEEKRDLSDVGATVSRIRNFGQELESRAERAVYEPEQVAEEPPPRIFDTDFTETDFWNYRVGSRLVLWRQKRSKPKRGPESEPERTPDTPEGTTPNAARTASEPLSGQWFLRGSYGTGRRVPLFVELFGERGSIIGNPDLRPERAETYELGTGLALRWRDFKGELELGGFRRDVRDMILFVPNSQFTLRPENIDAAKIRGAELGGRITAFDRVKLHGNYTYQRAINDSDVESLRGNYLPLRPLHELHSGLSLFNDTWEGGFEAIYVGAVFRDRTNQLPGYVEPRWIYNFHLRWSVYGKEREDREWLIALEIKNIQNRRITDTVGYPLPGRQAYLSMSYRF